MDTALPLPRNDKTREHGLSVDDRRQWSLWAVLALAVAGPGVLAWRITRDVGLDPPPQ